MEDRMRKFKRLVEAGSYTRAAQDLHISQPALTMAIQKLESELKNELISINGRVLELTAAGRITYQAAIEQQDLSKQLDASLARLNRKRPSFTIGMIDSIADTMCTSKAFAALEAQADVTLVVNNSGYLRDAVQHRKLDCALTIHDGSEYPGLETLKIGNELLRLVFHPSRQSSVDSSLANGALHEFISYDTSSTTFRHVSRFFIANGIHIHSRLYSTSPTVMLGMVQAGKGCAVLPDHMVRQLLANQQLLSALSAIRRPIALVSVSHKEIAKPLADFIAATTATLKSA